MYFFKISYVCLAVLNYEEDIALYTIKVANDPITCNHIVIYRPPKNIVSQLELISLWEKKIGRSFNKVHIPEEEIMKLSESKNLLHLKVLLIDKFSIYAWSKNIFTKLYNIFFLKIKFSSLTLILIVKLVSKVFVNLFPHFCKNKLIC